MIDQPGPYRIGERVRNVTLDALVIPDDVIEPSGLPQRRRVPLRVPASGPLFRVFDEPGQVRVARRAGQNEVQVVRHVAVREKLKRPSACTVAESSIRFGDDSRVPESLASRKGAERKEIRELALVFEARQPSDALREHEAKRASRMPVLRE